MGALCGVPVQQQILGDAKGEQGQHWEGSHSSLTPGPRAWRQLHSATTAWETPAPHCPATPEPPQGSCPWHQGLRHCGSQEGLSVIPLGRRAVLALHNQMDVTQYTLNTLLLQACR